jgi:hypothetical protein
MNKKIIWKSSQLIGIAILCLVVKTETRAMDSDYDPYWKGGGPNGARYHEGMKKITLEARRTSLDRCKIEGTSEDLLTNDFMFGRSGGTKQGVVVCSCCGEFVLTKCMRNFYERYLKGEMQAACVAARNVGNFEAMAYRWKWKEY